MSKKLALAVLAAFSAAAFADINVGVSVSATGPAASLGIPEKNTIALLPASIGGQKVNYIVLDDATDPTAATPAVAGTAAGATALAVANESTSKSVDPSLMRSMATSHAPVPVVALVIQCSATVMPPEE